MSTGGRCHLVNHKEADGTFLGLPQVLLIHIIVVLYQANCFSLGPLSLDHELFWAIHLHLALDGQVLESKYSGNSLIVELLF